MLVTSASAVRSLGDASSTASPLFQIFSFLSVPCALLFSVNSVFFLYENNHRTFPREVIYETYVQFWVCNRKRESLQITTHLHWWFLWQKDWSSKSITHFKTKIHLRSTSHKLNWYFQWYSFLKKKIWIENKMHRTARIWKKKKISQNQVIDTWKSRRFLEKKKKLSFFLLRNIPLL